MYRVYNVETLSKLVKTALVMDSHQILVEQLFAGQQVEAYKFILNATLCNKSLLYLWTIKEKYCSL